MGLSGVCCKLTQLNIFEAKIIFALFSLGPECSSFPVQGKGEAPLVRQGIDNELTCMSLIDKAIHDYYTYI